MTDAVVVGSGPNGLAAAITLAMAGVRVRVFEAQDTIGGGTRSGERTLPGLLHDDCSAVHPTGVGSPFLSGLGLEAHGLRWRWPEVDLVHPLDGGRAAVMWRDLDRTAQGLGVDGAAWGRVFGPLSRRFGALAEDVFAPILHVPHHPIDLLRFGSQALVPATVFARRWRSDEARALFTGVAAHAFSSLHAPLSSSAGLMLTAAGHAYGWPVAEGGSQAITTAMAARLADLGGSIETGVEVDSLSGLGDPDVVMLDTTPRAAARLLGDRQPARIGRAYRRFRYGPAAFKVDLAIEGPIPWTAEVARRAGTVHLGGSMEQIARSEESIVRGRMPSHPFVLVAQQYLADPTRSVGDLHPIWAYAHVPHAYRGDATEAVISQIERFAPGVRSQIRAVHVRDVAALEAHNANYIGGDIAAGYNNMWQLAMRPRVALDPYRTGVEGVYLCSSSTPPGAGVHGMCGFQAATSALSALG
jgi:phytoene dehydrogenase-like protein